MLSTAAKVQNARSKLAPKQSWGTAGQRYYFFQQAKKNESVQLKPVVHTHRL
jgi:hypothetical protein